MSYDLSLCCPVSGQVLESQVPHQMAGGTYCLGGTRDLTLNVTYNYSSHFYNTMGQDGIRTLSGKTGAESLPVLNRAIRALADDAVENYWEPTQGNAKRALKMLEAMALMRPDGVWSVT